MTAPACGSVPNVPTTSPFGDCFAFTCRAAGSYDFVEDRTHDGRKFRMLNVIDASPGRRLFANAVREFTRECPAIRVDRKLNSTDVIDVLSDLFILRGVPGHVRSDNGPEFIAKAVREWIVAAGAGTAFIEPGSPWENGYRESFNSRLRPPGCKIACNNDPLGGDFRVQS